DTITARLQRVAQLRCGTAVQLVQDFPFQARHRPLRVGDVPAAARAATDVDRVAAEADCGEPLGGAGMT
ncbi:MAG: hypothetical protein MUE66_06540, partial [Acidimicrobiia bacterium]|nr:hypothetical protein [Acidimicrobiia bacterium]